MQDLETPPPSQRSFNRAPHQLGIRHHPRDPPLSAQAKYSEVLQSLAVCHVFRHADTLRSSFSGLWGLFWEGKFRAKCWDAG